MYIHAPSTVSSAETKNEGDMAIKYKRQSKLPFCHIPKLLFLKLLQYLCKKLGIMEASDNCSLTLVTQTAYLSS